MFTSLKICRFGLLVRERIHRASVGNQGFTLLEVMVAMGILALVAGSVYGVLRATIQMTAGMEDARIRQQQVDGLLELCRKTFRMMPAQAIWEGRLRRQDGKVYPEIILRKAPEMLAWDQVTDFDAVSVLGVRPQVGGLVSISLLRISPAGNPVADPVSAAQAADWVALVTDLSKVEWRYYDPRSDLWLDELPAGGLRPAAVELKVWFPEKAEPLVVVFWVVPMANEVAVTIEKADKEKEKEPVP
jgi:prepilin-type N-terminal cleavage/methylation domain-containing protein